MASRTANIKVTLSTSAFTGEMKKTERQVAQSGKRMGQKLGKEMDNGFRKGQKALASMGKDMGRMIKQVGTLGAAFATGALVKDSVEIHKKFQDISFLLSRFPDQAKSWEEVQNMITGAANRTTRTTMEMALAFEQVYKAHGDAKAAAESLDMIGKAATATGAPVEQLAQVAEMIRRKYGATGKEAEEMMAKFVEGSNKGGLSLDSLSTRLDMVVGVAAEMGTDVTEVLGLISQLDDVMGEMAPRGIKTLLEYMREGTTQAKALEKAGHFKFSPDMDALERVRMIVKSPKAHKEALKVFTETSRTAFDELRKPYVETLRASKAAGDTEKVAQEKAVAAFDKMVAGIRKTEMTASDLDRMYEKRIQEDPSVKLRIAINKVRDAFAQPKMIDAIGKLADKLPGLAKAVADLIGFIVDNPLGAAGVGMGLRVGLPMAMQGAMFRGSGGGFGQFSGAAAHEAALRNMGGRGGGGGRGAGGGVGGLGNAASKATSPVKNLGMGAANAVGQFAGIAALAYTAGKGLEALIDAEADGIDEWQAMGMRLSNLYASAISGNATIEDQAKALKDATRERKAAAEKDVDIGAIPGMIPRAFEAFGAWASGDKTLREANDMAFGSDASRAIKKASETETKIAVAMAKKNGAAFAEAALRREKELAQAGGNKFLEAEALKNFADAVKAIAEGKTYTPAGGTLGSGMIGKGGARGRRKKLKKTPGAEPKDG